MAFSELIAALEEQDWLALSTGQAHATIEAGAGFEVIELADILPSDKVVDFFPRRGLQRRTLWVY